MSKVTDALPPPSNCDNCRSRRVKFQRETKHENKPMFICVDCGARVYCHVGSSTPLGYMADGPTREARVRAHAVFDPLWQHKLLTREEAYLWLSRVLGIERHHAHIGRLSLPQLDTIIRKAARHYKKLLADKHKRRTIEDASYRKFRADTDRQRKVYRRRKPSSTARRT